MIQHLEAEQTVLGTILARPEAAFIVEALSIDDFSEATHRLIFEAIVAKSAEGRAPSPVILAPLFQNDRIGDITVAQYLARLMNVSAPMEHAYDYVRTLKEFSGRRAMAIMGEQMQQVAGSVNQSILEFNEEVVGALDVINADMRKTKKTSRMIGEITRDHLDRLKAGQKPNLINTGLLDLNRDIGGWPRGELTIIAGRPSMGKTTLAVSSMRQAALQGVTSLFFSMEMAGDPISARMLSDAVFNSQTPIQYKDIIRGNVQNWNMERLEKAQERIEGLPLRVDEQVGLTASEIGVRARRYQDELERMGMALDVLWVDHLGFMGVSDRYKGFKVHETGEKTQSLKALAKSLGVSIIALCQLNRGLEGRDNKRPQLQDLRDSGNIEEDSDTVIFAYREAYYLDRIRYDDPSEEADRVAKLELMANIIEAIGAKTRNGPVFVRRLFADMGSNAIRDLAA